MKPTRVVVKITCQCGNRINIRAEGSRASVRCWECDREVGFTMRGWMKAEGYCVVEGRGKVYATAVVISQEST